MVTKGDTVDDPPVVTKGGTGDVTRDVTKGGPTPCVGVPVAEHTPVGCDEA
jgi:hypothetical protein